MKKFYHADNEDSDQTAQMCSLIRVFVVRTCQKVYFLMLSLIGLQFGRAMGKRVIGHMRTAKASASAQSDQDLHVTGYCRQGLETSGYVMISGLSTFILSMKFHYYTGSQDHPLVSKVVIWINICLK